MGRLGDEETSSHDLFSLSMRSSTRQVVGYILLLIIIFIIRSICFYEYIISFTALETHS